MRDVSSELEYYLGFKPSAQTLAEAEEWLEMHPNGDLSEWAEAMIEIGAL